MALRGLINALARCRLQALFNARDDRLGIAACVMSLISALLFSHVSAKVLFVDIRWDLSFGATAMVGLILAITGIIRMFIIRGRFAVFSAVALVLNGAPVGFMLLVFALGSTP